MENIIIIFSFLKRCAVISISMLLIAIFIFDSGTVCLWFKINQLMIYREIRQKIGHSLHDKDLTIIKVTSLNSYLLHWYKKNKEFFLSRRNV